LAELPNPPESLPMTVFFHSQPVEVHLGFPERQPELLGPRGLLDQLADVQQGLGGNAALMQADAAQGGGGLDQGGLHAELGSPERRGVAARAAADDQQIRFLCEFAYDHVHRFVL